MTDQATTDGEGSSVGGDGSFSQEAKIPTEEWAMPVLADSSLWAIGVWLSAALDDPDVCDEMKRDIREWFDASASEKKAVKRLLYALEPFAKADPINVVTVEDEDNEKTILTENQFRLARSTYEECFAPLSLLIDQEWLDKRVAADPDGDCEAGCPPSQSAWLIERGDGPRPTWLKPSQGYGENPPTSRWTLDASLAQRFGSKAEAERYIQHRHPALYGSFASEHLFLGDDK